MGVIDPREERFDDERPRGIGRVAGADREPDPRADADDRDDGAPPVRRRFYDDDRPRPRDDDELAPRRDDHEPPRRREVDESRRRFDDEDRPRRDLDRPRREFDDERPIRRLDWSRADDDRGGRHEVGGRGEREFRREPSAWERRSEEDDRPRRRFDDEPRRRGDEEVDHRAVLILAAIAVTALLLAASGALR